MGITTITDFKISSDAWNCYED